MDSKIPKPFAHQQQRKVITKSSQNLFDFNSIKKGAVDATKKPLTGRIKTFICY